MEDNKEIIINNAVKGHILDISEAGIYIHTQADFIQGAMLDLSFAINEKQIKVKGLIQHIKPGVGIEILFLNLLPDNLACIKNFMSARSSLAKKESPVKKLLLVDDSAQQRSAYRNKLIEEGFIVTEAQSGTEAFMRLQELKFDIVILDLWIEGIDGFKILHIMKVNPVLKEIPVIILSARSTPDDIKKAMALGATDYLVKMTTTPAKLAEKVKELFPK